MELYIQIRDGEPFEHPILGDNFREAFPHIDTNNLPNEFARFERVPVPQDKEYEVHQGITYEWVGDVVRDVHHYRPMTDEEKAVLNEQKAREKELEISEIINQSTVGVTRV
jgi:hypothetical protein